MLHLSLSPPLISKKSRSPSGRLHWWNYFFPATSDLKLTVILTPWTVIWAQQWKAVCGMCLKVCKNFNQSSRRYTSMSGKFGCHRSKGDFKVCHRLGQPGRHPQTHCWHRSSFNPTASTFRRLLKPQSRNCIWSPQGTKPRSEREKEHKAAQTRAFRWLLSLYGWGNEHKYNTHTSVLQIYTSPVLFPTKTLLNEYMEKGSCVPPEQKKEATEKIRFSRIQKWRQVTCCDFQSISSVEKRKGG